jgi:filamentous hemagglutinin family protein
MLTAGLLAALTSLSPPAAAQIRTDGSLGHPAQSLVGPNYAIPQSIGLVSGANLFQSFSTFNLATGESATFTTTTAGIANIISRITGGTPSSLNGPITVTAAAGAPNFFFINPAGVTFGAGAAINVPAGLHVTTANYLKFADGQLYSDLTHVSTFSALAPEAFGFLGTSRATITVGNTAVLTQTSAPITITAGDVAINDGGVFTYGAGDVRIAAVGSDTVEVPLTGNLPVVHGTLTVTNGGEVGATATTQNSGNVALSAGTITIDSQGSPNFTGVYTDAPLGSSGNAGTVQVTAASGMTLANFGSLSTTTESSGSAGGILINVNGPLALSGEALLYSQSNGSGAAGPVQITSTGPLSVVSGAEIFSQSTSSGNSGPVQIAAGGLSIDSQGSNVFTGIFTDAAAGSLGNTGAVNLAVTGSAVLQNAGSITSTTESGGSAGGISFSATGPLSLATNASIYSASYGGGSVGPVQIAGAASIALSGDSLIYSQANAAGAAGGVQVGAKGALSIDSGSQIFTQATASGASGALQVTAGSLAIDSETSPFVTGIYSDAASGTGAAGALNIAVAGPITLQNSALITTSSEGAGSSGALSISASGPLSMASGAQIYSKSIGTGNSGAVLLDTGGLSMDGTLVASGAGAAIYSASTASGSAGAVTLDIAGGVLLSNSANIFTLSQSSANGGTLDLLATGPVSLASGALVSTAAYGSANAGSIHVSGAGITINDAGATGGGIQSSNSAGAGAVGAVTVDSSAGISLLNGGTIRSNSFSDSATSGDVIINAKGNLLMTNFASISSGTQGLAPAGDITVSAANITLVGTTSARTFIESNSEGSAAGRAGDISISTPGTLALVEGGAITSATSSAASGGLIQVKAGALSINGSGAVDATTISASAVHALGSGGSVDVDVAGALSIVDGGLITAGSIESTGGSGSLQVSAGSLLISGGGVKGKTGITSSSTSTGAGTAGSVQVDVAGNLTLLAGGTIEADSYLSGAAGSLDIRAANILIDGFGAAFSTTSFCCLAEAGYPGLYAGNAGSIRVAASGFLDLVNGGEISSSTLSPLGRAGSVDIAVANLSVVGPGSGILAQAAAGSSGQTGSITIEASNSVSLADHGSLSISSAATVAEPGLLSPTLLSVTSPNISLADGAEIAAVAIGNTAASDIRIRFGNELLLDPSAISTQSRDGNGGSIAILGGAIIDLSQSAITTSVSGTSGNGGNITIESEALVMNSGFIQANTAAAKASGGNVSIDVDVLLPSGSSLFVGGEVPYRFQPDVFGFNVIQAAAPSGLSGTIEISNPALNLSGSLSSLAEKFLQAGGLGRSPCQGNAGSTLTPAGRGGFAPAARDLVRADTPAGPQLASGDLPFELLALRVECAH